MSQDFSMPYCFFFFLGIHGVLVTICKKWTWEPEVQTLDEAVIISHPVNSLEKGLHPTILPPDIGKK